MKFPKVSVIIATYNRPDMLLRCVKAVLAQTYRDFEVIVVDDGSKTAVRALSIIGDKFEEADIRLRVLDMPENTGYSTTPFNAGIHHSCGTYIAYCDDDNEWDPDHLELLIDKIESSGAEFVYSRWRYKGKGIKDDLEFPYNPPTRAARAGLVQKPEYNFIDTSSILHAKAAVIAKLGPSIWNEDARRVGDWHFARTCILLGVKMDCVNKVTFSYYWHDSNIQKTRPMNETAAELGEQRDSFERDSWTGGDSVWRG